MDIVLGIKNILKSVTALKLLAKQDALEWPTFKLLLGRIKQVDGEMSYQGATLKNSASKCQEKTKEEAMQDLVGLNDKMREHDLILNCYDPLLVFLETQTWMKRTRTSSANSLLIDDEGDCNLTEVKEAVEHISTHFRLPLEAKRVSFVSL